MPEEATEVHDKQELYYRRFNKRLRDRLKGMITPELIAEHIKGQDIIITTALIPGRRAPKLISKQMIESMKPVDITNSKPLR